MSSKITLELGPAPCSKAHSWVASSIFRRLLRQALTCDWLRALTKFGMAIAASMPIKATTIIISMSVKPRVRIAAIFIRFIWPGASACVNHHDFRRSTIQALYCIKASPDAIPREHYRCQTQKYEGFKVQPEIIDYKVL